MLLKLRDRFITAVRDSGAGNESSIVTTSILSLLAAGPVSEDDLSTSIMSRHGEVTLSEFFYALNQIKYHNLIEYIISAAGSVLASVRPANGRFQFLKAVLDPERRYSFSRFAYARTNGPDLILESPIAEMVRRSTMRSAWRVRTRISTWVATWCWWDRLDYPRPYCS